MPKISKLLKFVLVIVACFAAIGMASHLAASVLVNLSLWSVRFDLPMIAAGFEVDALQVNRQGFSEAAWARLIYGKSLLDRATAIQPNHAPSLRHLGQFSSLLGDDGTAIAALSDALQRNPDDDLSRLFLANTYHVSKQAASALNEYAALLQRTTTGFYQSRWQRLWRDNQVYSEIGLARTALQAGDPASALQHYRQALLAHPGNLLTVWEGLSVAADGQEEASKQFMRNELDHFEISTDRRLCVDSISAVMGLVDAGFWSAAQGKQAMSLLIWSGCTLDTQNLWNKQYANLLAETAPLPPAVLKDCDPFIMDTFTDSRNLVVNPSFEEISEDWAWQRGLVEPQPLCWRWVVWDKPQHKRSFWYAGLEPLDRDTEHVLRITGVWIEDGEGANPAAGYGMCGPGLELSPGETVRLSLIYRTDGEMVRSAVWLGDYHWLLPSSDWASAQVDFTNNTPHSMNLAPILYLFSVGTVRYDRVFLITSDE